MPVTFDIARNRMSASIYRFGAFILNASARELVRDGERIALPPRAFACLLMLVESRERALGREELIGALWRRGVASDVQLGQLIVQCRRALDDDGQKQWAIRTVPGFGYQWVAAIDGGDAVAVAGTAADVGNDRGGESASAMASAPVEVGPPPRPAGTPAVEAAAAPLPLPRRGRPRRVALACAIAVAAVAVAAFSWRRAQRPAPAPAAARMLVLPLAVEGDDQAWLRLGGMDLVADRLRRGGFMVQPSEQTVGQLRALGADSGDATQALRRANTSATLVDGRVEHRDGRWFARVSAGRADAPPASANADATTPIAALGAAGRKALWRAMAAAARGADIISLKYVPEGLPLEELGDRLEADILYRSHFSSWEEANATQRSKSRRKHDRQQGERLEALGAVAFEEIPNGPEALEVLDVMFRQRAARFVKMGVRDPFACKTTRAFYDATVAADSGVPVKLDVLRLNGGIVAVRYNIAHGDRLFCLISSMSEDEAIQVGSPGKQCLLRVMQTVFDAGYTTFDMGVGFTDEKRHWCNEQIPVAHHYLPLTARGWLAARAHRGWHSLRHAIKTNERLRKLVLSLRSRVAARPAPASD